MTDPQIAAKHGTSCRCGHWACEGTAKSTAASVPESEWIGGCPTFGRARSPQECEKCDGDLLKCPVYGDGERKRQTEDRAASVRRYRAARRTVWVEHSDGSGHWASNWERNSAARRTR